MHALARITSFRDVLLDRQPILLDAFLEQALVAGESEVSAPNLGMFPGKMY